jgi:hypothetical protein
MAIPSSGALSAQTINFELARSRTSELSIDTAENGGYVAINRNSPSRPNSANPAAYSEWYSYDHTAGSGPLYSPILLGYNATSANRACSAFYFSPITQYVLGPVTPPFNEVPQIFTNESGASYSRGGWYSDGNVNKLWNGSGGFTNEELCIL